MKHEKSAKKSSDTLDYLREAVERDSQLQVQQRQQQQQQFMHMMQMMLNSQQAQTQANIELLKKRP